MMTKNWRSVWRTPATIGRNAYRYAPGDNAIEGGGDRVALSKDLASDMAMAGLYEPHRKTYASRKPKGA